MGGSTAGEIVSERPLSHSCVVLVVSSEELACSVGMSLDVDKTPREAGHRAAYAAVRDFKGPQRTGFLMFGDGLVTSYAEGELKQETLEKEVLDGGLVLDPGEGESALAVPFACDRVERLADDRYELISPDGTERVVFLRNADGDGALQPVSWRSDESTRLLWKKLVIEAVAEYRNFEWRPADREPR